MRRAVKRTETHSRDSAYHRITVEDRGHLRVMRFERNRQSSMYLDAPFDTDFEYPAYFHLALALNPRASRTLVIGLGGGTVVKRMWRDYPEMLLDVVELDPEVVEVAREYFALPEDERIRVHVGDGREFVEGTSDAFDDDRVPRPLTTEEFMRAVRGRLGEDGVVVYNLIGYLRGDRDKPFRSLYRTLANVWREVWVFKVDEGVDSEGSNIILLATDDVVPAEDLLARIRGRVDGRVSVPAFHTFGDDLYTGPIRGGDVPIIVDPPNAERKRGRRPAE
jgi:spermidine synthase